MSMEKSVGRRLFKERFVQIEDVIECVCRKKGLRAEEAEELYGLVMLKLVQDDYAVLRDFQERSSWRTYLIVIVHRVLLDDRTRRWGRWRPSVISKRLGKTAIHLDRLINRDGWDASEAVAILRAQGAEESDSQLEDLAERIPRRVPRRLHSAEPFLEELWSAEPIQGQIEAEEAASVAMSVETSLEQAIHDLSEDQRQLLELRFACGWTVRRIAEVQRVPVRPLYAKFGRILGRLRRDLEAAGIDWTMVKSALDGDIDLGGSFASDVS